MAEDPAFPQTRWTLLKVLRDGSAEDAQSALETLCSAYWFPLYVYARSRGLKEFDAEDSVQSFFAHVLRRELFARAEKGRGRLRWFLLSAYERFRINEWRKNHAGNNGAVVEWPLRVSAEEAEQRYLQNTTDGEDAFTLFNREWARNLLERCLDELRREHEADGQGARFEALASVMLGSSLENEPTSLAEKLGMSQVAFRQALYRLRRRYREKIEAELALILGTSDQEVIRNEMQELCKSFD
jgi:DNA-directed RNA polymerase specialized sigma24 family protein